MKNKILANTTVVKLLLVLVFIFRLLTINVNATQTRTYNFSTNYTITGNLADDIVAVAGAQIGKTQSVLGYTESWCADFVCDCAKLTGMSDSIIPYNYPSRGACSYLYNYMINNCGAYVVASPQKGDIVFYKDGSTFCHVAIMTDSTYSIHGNYYPDWITSQVYRTNYTAYYTDKGNKASPIFVRPKYTEPYANIGDDFYAVIFHSSSWKPVELNNDGFLCLGTEDGTYSELWHFSRLSNGYYIIRNANGKYLDIYGGYASNGKELLTSPYHGNSSQLWYLEITDAGNVNIISSQGLAIDLNGGDASKGVVNLWERNTSNAQRWTIYKTTDIIGQTTLEVNTNTSDDKSLFKWNLGGYATEYYLKIWRGTLWEGYAFAVYCINNSTKVFNVDLPAGYYEAYVDSVNAFGAKMSNVVRFSVTPGATTVVCDKNTYKVGDTVFASWNKIADATHYNWYIFKKDINGNYEFFERAMECKYTSLELNLLKGEYYIKVQSYNSNYWFPDHSDWVYTQSEPFYFVVEEDKTDLPLNISVNNLIKTTNILSINFEINNDSYAPVLGKLYYAIYSDRCQLKSVIPEEINLEKKSMINVSKNINKCDKDKVKFFVWDENLRPLSNCISIVD